MKKAIFILGIVFLFTACQTSGSENQKKQSVEPQKSDSQATSTASVSETPLTEAQEPVPSYDQIKRDADIYFEAISKKDSQKCLEISQEELKITCKKLLQNQ